MNRAALISVSDRTGLVEFAASLKGLGFTLLTTSGSGKALSENGISSVGIDEYTGQNEILDGRVKTLHPKIHAGLLAKRDKPNHLKELEQNSILPIEVAVVNLYPFLEKVKTEAAAKVESMIEFIDIGGPTMIRAAAKNHASVLPVIDPQDYPEVIKFLKEGSALGKRDLEFRRYLASKVFTAIALYDLEIARYMAGVAESGEQGAANGIGALEGGVWQREQTLRYGENPHQQGAFYRSVGASEKRSWSQLNGKDLSYNNFLDVDAAVRMISQYDQSSAVAIIIKHANPCGAAKAESHILALQKAKLCDPRSHFGGIIGFNGTVTREIAENIREDFAEVIIAPEYEPAALSVLQTSKALRVLKFSTEASPKLEIRSALDGILVQERDNAVSNIASLEVVSKRQPTAHEVAELQFAWSICANVKSNAIVIVKNSMLIGVGAGQMSRVDSVELAISKARTHSHDTRGAVAASDAFFPFTDGIETLARAGVTCVVAPAGAKRDAEVIETANKEGITLIFTPDRHFRH